MKRILGLVLAAIATLACDAGRKDLTTVEVLQAERLPGDQLSLEIKYVACPGDARRVVRLDRDFTACAGHVHAGDKMEAEIATRWVPDRSVYRSEIVRLGSCAVKLDPAEEANYERVQICRDVVTTGAVVGVRCERTRSKELLDKCPWLRRR